MENFPTLWKRSSGLSPMGMMSQMQRQIDRMFNDFYSGEWSKWASEFSAPSQMEFQPLCDVQETDSHYLLSLDLPGMSKSDVKVEMVGDTLKVYGERKDEREKTKGSQVRTERYYGAFERRMTLPENVKTDGIEAQFDNGVLHIAVPKVEAAKPKPILVTDQKSGLISKILGKKEEKAA